MRPLLLPKYVQQIWQSNLSNQEKIQSIKAAYGKIHSNTPIVSVVIPAYNEEESILQTLMALTNNIVSVGVEIIVVNNNSTDATQALVTASGVECITEFKKGITAARTAGLNAAKGNIILNADADTIYPKYWIELMSQPLINNNSIALTYGRFAFIPVGKTPRWMYFFYEYFSGFSRLLNKYFKDEAVNVYGFNSGYRKVQGLAVDGYAHPPGSNEDGYLALKLRNKGFGTLHKVNKKNALVWTTDRRIQSDGGFLAATIKRIKRMLIRPKEMIVRSDL